jgi:tetratricopeptide (TPR) repeat protein
VGWCYYLAGDYDHAEEAEKNTIQMDPSFVSARGYLGQVYAAKRQYAEAVDEFRAAVSLSPGDVAGQADLGHGYAVSGKREQAQEILREMQAEQGTKYVSAYDFAVVYAGFRDVDNTLEWLEKAYVERNGRMANLGVHPQFAFLRREPRWQRLVERIWGTKLIEQSKPSLRQNVGLPRSLFLTELGAWHRLRKPV